MNISTIISEIYKTYAAKLARSGIHLDIDIPDPSLKVAKPSAIKKTTTTYLDFCLKHPEKSTILLTVQRGNFYIKDDTRLLLPETRAIFDALATTTHTKITARSRLGFGTTITIPLG